MKSLGTLLAVLITLAGFAIKVVRLNRAIHGDSVTSFELGEEAGRYCGSTQNQSSSGFFSSRNSRSKDTAKPASIQSNPFVD
ncbi:hypothetical protein [Novipirellula artificiosorum]|uniref:Uncharacterized protein n=1 Tax=Novipirellula artificiosorum TaxID=2528016 RepID=A0A5C6D3X4_9BACT|nr:hypothetical protein [Novipirellula artificiosorum]TWU31592.1 hypothetical protein Poly41_61490 [Novipirellula artificiosorum]